MRMRILDFPSSIVLPNISLVGYRHTHRVSMNYILIIVWTIFSTYRVGTSPTQWLNSIKILPPVIADSFLNVTVPSCPDMVAASQSMAFCSRQRDHE